MRKKKNKKQQGVRFVGKYYIFACMSKHEKNIQIRCVPKNVCDILQNISENTGVRVSTILKTNLQPILDAYSNELKNDAIKIEDGNITIKYVPEKMKKEIKNISKNLGVTTSSFLKIAIRPIIEKYPKNTWVNHEEG